LTPVPIARQLAAGRRATSIAQATEVMSTLDRELDDTDGLWWFNRLYLRVTLAVRDAVMTSTFRDVRFLEQLDVIFANLYFDAIAAGDQDWRKAPPAWRPLFQCRRRTGIRSIQFALSGMNAHINRDLPQGIVATYLATGGTPEQRGPRYDDFTQVNDLLEAVEAQIKVEFSTGLVARIDAAGGETDDAVAMWKVRAARETAWTHAEVLWALRSAVRLREAFFSRLDRLTGFAGRGLLIPTTVLSSTRAPGVQRT
jgi:hypothetical protein